MCPEYEQHELFILCLSYLDKNPNETIMRKLMLTLRYFTIHLFR